MKFNAEIELNLNLIEFNLGWWLIENCRIAGSHVWINRSIHSMISVLFNQSSLSRQNVCLIELNQKSEWMAIDQTISENKLLF